MNGVSTRSPKGAADRPRLPTAGGPCHRDPLLSSSSLSDRQWWSVPAFHRRRAPARARRMDEPADLKLQTPGG
jgi:hypothetical protein